LKRICQNRKQNTDRLFEKDIDSRRFTPSER
jgi:hypothetical protein